jgi:hypothetical protein
MAANSTQVLKEVHRRMLEVESGIRPDVIAARGYRTVTCQAELGRLGFGPSQRLTPALLLPVWTVHGEIGLYQARPDSPRIRKDKAIKYETPCNARMALDCHPFVRPELADPSKPLLITEGIKKGDALVSHGCVAVALLGVWNYRGTNQYGGKTALPDWEMVALHGRIVYIVFDSDIMTKPSVYQALLRLKEFLESRGAVVYVVYLECGPGGAKCGVDDFLVAGHTIDELVHRATETVQVPIITQDTEPNHPYRSTPHGIVAVRRRADGIEEVPLTNFVANLATQYIVDDGIEQFREYDIEATVGNEMARGRIAGDEFMRPDQWVPRLLGAHGVLPPGRARQDMVRQAIQLLSPEAETIREYAHTGWRVINGQPVYLHAGGGIGSNGPVDGVQVRLSPRLSNLKLTPAPAPGELQQALRAASELFHLPNMIPLIAWAFLAPLVEILGAERPDCVLWVYGPTGAHKSERAALTQSFFGDYPRTRLPASFKDTANAIEKLLFETKDALTVVDDYYPACNASEAARLEDVAAKLVRGVGNACGRARMKADMTPRHEYRPRGVVIVTAERLLGGHSNTARVLPVSVWPIEDRARLTRAQASRDLLPCVMAAYVQHLASRYDELRGSLPERFRHYRQEAQSLRAHSREPGQIAHLRLGNTMFLEFLTSHGVLTTEEQRVWQERADSEFLAMAREHATTLRSENVTERFRDLLVSGFAGKQVYLEARDGGEPADPELWGWHVFTGQDEDGNETRKYRPAANGKLVGRANDTFIDLYPEALYQFLVGAARSSGQVFPVDLTTLLKRLHESGWIEADRDGHLKVQAKISGQKIRVIRLKREALYPGEEGTEAVVPTVPATGGALGTPMSPHKPLVCLEKEPAVPSVPTVPSVSYTGSSNGRAEAQDGKGSIAHRGDVGSLYTAEGGYSGYVGYEGGLAPLGEVGPNDLEIDLKGEAVAQGEGSVMYVTVTRPMHVRLAMEDVTLMPGRLIKLEFGQDVLNRVVACARRYIRPLRVGSVIAWESPVFGQCTGRVTKLPEGNLVGVCDHSVTRDVDVIHLHWIREVCPEPEETEVVKKEIPGGHL